MTTHQDVALESFGLGSSPGSLDGIGGGIGNRSEFFCFY